VASVQTDLSVSAQSAIDALPTRAAANSQADRSGAFEQLLDTGNPQPPPAQRGSSDPRASASDRRSDAPGSHGNDRAQASDRSQTSDRSQKSDRNQADRGQSRDPSETKDHSQASGRGQSADRSRESRKAARNKSDQPDHANPSAPSDIGKTDIDDVTTDAPSNSAKQSNASDSAASASVKDASSATPPVTANDAEAAQRQDVAAIIAAVIPDSAGAKDASTDTTDASTSLTDKPAKTDDSAASDDVVTATVIATAQPAVQTTNPGEIIAVFVQPLAVPTEPNLPSGTDGSDTDLLAAASAGTPVQATNTPQAQAQAPVNNQAAASSPHATPSADTATPDNPALPTEAAASDKPAAEKAQADTLKNSDKRGDAATNAAAETNVAAAALKGDDANVANTPLSTKEAFAHAADKAAGNAENNAVNNTATNAARADEARGEANTANTTNNASPAVSAEPAAAALQGPTTFAAGIREVRQERTEAVVPVSGVAVEIATRFHNGERHFEIRLDPPDLGRIDVQLHVDAKGHVTSHLVVERTDTLDLLKRDAPTLERALESAGLKTSDNGLQFSLRDQSSNGRDQNARNAAPSAHIVVPDEELPTVDTALRGYGRMLGRGTGVDISV
jgi:chemotaxis protein MotD